MNNIILAYAILKYLQLNGTADFLIAPGSRSSPFVFALHLLKDVNIHTHFDERALPFIALGIAKASNKKVAVITTSGSAVGNLLPGIMEAHSSDIPLTIITADRPYEMHNIGCNQTCNQENIFSTYALFLQIRTIDSNFTLEKCISLINQFYVKAIQKNTPIHFNVEMREPLYDNQELDTYYLNKIDYLLKNQFYLDSHNFIAFKDCLKFICNLLYAPSTLLLIGNLSLQQTKTIQKIINKTHINYLADIQSGLRTKENYSCLCNYSKSIDNLKEYLNSFTNIIIINGRFISTKLLEALKGYKNNLTFISENDRNYNCLSLPARKFQISFDEIYSNLHQNPSIQMNTCNTNTLASKELDNDDYLNEISAVRYLNLAPEKNLFIGNSLVCRIADAVLFNTNHNIFTNRGVSGIDGLIATSCGIALQDSTISVIGDTTALYDLSSIALMKNKLLKLVIFNNNGGNIFYKFDIKQDKVMSKYFVNDNNVNFSHISKMFDIKYHNPKTLNEYLELIKTKITEPIIIEVNFPQAEGINLLSKI